MNFILFFKQFWKKLKEKRNISIENSPSKFFTNIQKVMGSRVKTFVRRGFALMDVLVEKPALVNFGDTVEIIAESGAIVVTASGRSMGKGYIGSMVRVQNEITKKIIMAKIVGERKKKISF